MDGWSAKLMMLQLTRPNRIVPQHFEARYTMRFLDAISGVWCKSVGNVLFTVLPLLSNTSNHHKSRENKEDRTSEQTISDKTKYFFYAKRVPAKVNKD